MTQHSLSQLGGRLRQWGERIWFSFPVQLLGLQLRQNHLLLTLWVLLALFISDRIAAKFGVKYLFLEPEYNGVVGPLSFLLVGIGLGGLIMTWNLTSYLLSARYFPFLATLRRPFGKYCINNAVLPLAFLVFYGLHLRAFLKHELNYGNGQLLGSMSSLLLGVVLVIVAYVTYFRLTNKDIATIPDLRNLLPGSRHRRRRIISANRGLSVSQLVSGEQAWRVDNFFNESFQSRRTRSISHYRPEHLLSVFRQNHFNALALQLSLITLLVLAGLGMDYAWVRIPAGASVFILFSVVAAVTGAVTYWFHSWRTSIFLLLLLAVNMATSRDWFTYRNQAYGLDYSGKLPTYDYAALVDMANPRDVAVDRDSMQIILERWRRRTGQLKPKLVLLCVSGGGLKATYWTTHVLQEAQRQTTGQVLRHTALISGASGGMIGAAYVREQLLQREATSVKTEGDQAPPADALGDHLLSKTYFAQLPQLHGLPQLTRRDGRDLPPKWIPADRPSPYHLNPSVNTATQQDTQDSLHLTAVGGDLLNSVAFAIVTTDILLPTRSFEYDGKYYRRDRAYAFEQQLNENVNGAFRKRLGDYEAAERSAAVPMLLLTPSIVNDARRLIISPLGVRHLTLPPAGVGRAEDFEVDAVDFGNFFKGQQPEQLAFSTALRMNATYPYVLPNVYLPSTPPVEVMDAGFRDNFGVTEASRFLQVYREWILANTSGVVMMQVSTLEKFDQPKESSPKGWITSLFSPLGVAGQLISLQDFQIDDTVGMLYELYGQDNFTFLRFSYRPAEDREAASMTFHLTEGEKADIRASIRQPNNMLAFQRLKASLGSGFVGQLGSD